MSFTFTFKKPEGAIAPPINSIIYVNALGLLVQGEVDRVYSLAVIAIAPDGSELLLDIITPTLDLSAICQFIRWFAPGYSFSESWEIDGENGRWYSRSIQPETLAA